VWVADTDQAFGEYVSYRTYDPKPVVGTQGLTAVAWHPSYEQYAGMQLQDEFERFAKRDMTERDYTGWLAVRAIGEAATRSGKTDIEGFRDYILSDGRWGQGGGDELSQMGSPAPPTNSDRRPTRRRLHLPAARIPASEVPHRHARLRPAGDQMQVS